MNDEENESTTFKPSSFANMGTFLAIVLSWSINSSFWWALLHGMFGWFYAIYWGFEYAGLGEFVRSFIVGG